jgi:hypothetical protein
LGCFAAPTCATFAAQDGADQVQIFTRIELRERRFSKGQRLSLKCGFQRNRLCLQLFRQRPSSPRCECVAASVVERGGLSRFIQLSRAAPVTPQAPTASVCPHAGAVTLGVASPSRLRRPRRGEQFRASSRGDTAPPRINLSNVRTEFRRSATAAPLLREPVGWASGRVRGNNDRVSTVSAVPKQLRSDCSGRYSRRRLHLRLWNPEATPTAA